MDHQPAVSPLPTQERSGPAGHRARGTLAVVVALVVDVLVTFLGGNVLDARTGALCDLGDRFSGDDFFQLWGIGVAFAVVAGFFVWTAGRRRLLATCLVLGAAVLPLASLFVVASACTG